MITLPDDLLRRVAERANDPRRRYMTAAQDEARVELSVEEIKRRERDWAATLIRQSAAQFGEKLSDQEFERRLTEWTNQQQSMRRMMESQMRAWGQQPPTTMSFLQGDGRIGSSTRAPGATPLSSPPAENDWKILERASKRPIPLDLRQLYTVADGGFGPGFQGLYSVRQIASNCEDLRRRGPDYCGSIPYPKSYLPLAEESLTYHYDLDTGRIISSNPDWLNQGLEREDIYDVAFQSLAAMMEDWLGRS